MILRKLSLCLLALSLICVRAGAQQTQPAAAPPTRVAIKAGRLLNVRTGEVARNVFIVIEGQRIVSVGGTAPVGVPLIALESLIEKAIEEDLMLYPADRDLGAVGLVTAAAQKAYPCRRSN